MLGMRVGITPQVILEANIFYDPTEYNSTPDPSQTL